MAKLWREGLFQPQTLEEAIALVTDMYAIFKFQGIPVIRMGLQPTEDLNLNSSFLLAGPFHPSFGYLVQCNLKKKQMEMLAEGYGDDIRFLCSREDMPLLFGEKRKNVEAFSKKRRCGVSAVSLERGTVALAPFDKKQREHRIRTLTEREFLAEYMKQLQFWSEMCI